jgi:hemolysin III
MARLVPRRKRSGSYRLWPGSTNWNGKGVDGDLAWQMAPWSFRFWLDIGQRNRPVFEEIVSRLNLTTPEKYSATMRRKQTTLCIMATLDQPVKPKLRGVSHGIGFIIAIGLGIFLFTQSSAFMKPWCVLYSLTLCFMMGASALYHLPEWNPQQRQWMRRLDHCGIFLLIAGSSTPFAFVLPPESQTGWLQVVWAGAFIGCVRALVWITAPKWLVAALAIGVGWAVSPFIPQLKIALGADVFPFIVYGGAAYTLGALAYGFKRPNIFPAYFGYHELFHLLVLIGAGCHYWAVFQVRSIG